MPQDWFDRHAPDVVDRSSNGDWFDAHTPKAGEPRMVTSHEPEGESDIEQPIWKSKGVTLRRIADAAKANSPLRMFEKENLPGTMAAVAGGVAAPFTAGMSIPAAMALTGAAAGAAGAVGRGGVELAEGADLPTAATEAGKAGLMHGALGTLGAVPIEGAMTGAASKLYSGLLKAKQGLKNSFPGGGEAIVKTALEEAAPITEGGLQKVKGRLGESRGKALDMVKSADDAGATLVEPEEVIQKFRPVISTLRKRIDIGKPSELPQVGQRGRGIVRTTDRGLPVTRAQQLKEEAQDAASGAYRARDLGNVKELSADDLLDEATAKGFQESVETRVPGIAGQNKRTQSLKGASLALEDAVDRQSNNLAIGGVRDLFALGGGTVGAAAGGPVGAATLGLAMRALASPGPGSRVAIALYKAGRLPLNKLMQALAIDAQLGASSQDSGETVPIEPARGRIP